VERLANVSHATWIVQGVRDGRTFENPYGPGPIGYADSPEGRDDAERKTFSRRFYKESP
jgi:hypothetical protein